jgi:PAS domain-containing protein
MTSSPASQRDSAAAPRGGVTPRRINQDVVRKVLAAVAGEGGDLSAVLRAMEEPLIAFDSGRTILCANPSGERFFGYGPGELNGRSTDLLIPVRLRQPDAPPMA